MTETKQTVDSGFDELGIKDTILASIKKLGFLNPTPIQEKTIPIGINGQDLIGVAQTGTGKTFAFGVPMLQRIGAVGGRGLVLLPTRELALQVEDSLKKLGTSLGLKTASFIGGEAMERQLYALRKNPHIIIATPGRLIDYLKRKFLTLDDIKVLVLDEADMMFDMGFAPQVEEILTKVPKERQTMLFSATMPASIVKLTASHMKMPVSIEVAPSGTTAEKVDQEMYIMHKEDRIKHLERILNEYQGSVLVFVRTKHSVTGLTEQIRKFGHSAEEIHSNLSLRNRRRALDDFKSGKARVLVATDIAARGLDVNGIELVVNYNLPDKLSDYVHRIGRTGRAGKSGKAISFATPDQSRDIRDIERIINQELNLTKFAEPQSFAGRSRSAKPSRSRFTSRPGYERGKRSSFPKEGTQDLQPKYTPSLNNTPTSFAKAPYKKFGQAPRNAKPNFNDGPKKYSRNGGRDNFERDQKPNHLPKFNNKPDFGMFNFLEEMPTHRSASSHTTKFRGQDRNNPARTKNYKGRDEANPSQVTKYQSRDRASSSHTSKYKGQDRTSSPHAKYKGRDRDRNTSDRPNKPFKAKNKFGFRKSR